ncbi:Thermopsin [Caldisphaera lagunensis DSM 15908]|uniref:Thermopsin n=1 Tax=Caldisphaera lagunensis (strain DSM 15908 / JCM 11604 / ANMR 0165 / IC-154) TaxID=1056495 RepID=L0ADU6_CALLD|nr:thermopsin family protease [Caldisphaera lagunensis]AFZ71220.1 Thermopsin [Caldisphaera lagunensis DSM 15908]
MVKTSNFKLGMLLILFTLLSLILMIPFTHSMKITKYEGTKNNLSMKPIKIGFQSGLNESVGINDNGSMLVNNNVIDYSYSTNSLLGYFSFNGGDFYSGSPINYSGFSVQLNSNFNVTNSMTLWAQDVFGIQYQNGIYYVYILDNLWNSTYPSFSINQSLVTGNGNFSTYNQQTFYYSFAISNNNIITYETFAPFNLYAKMDINQSSNGYPQIYMYYDFQNSTYNSGWILYDVITILVKSNNPQFLTGIQSINSYAPYSPFVTQWVVGGESSGAQLSVYNWNASMSLYYEYEGKYYSVPDAISLQPSFFTAYATAENVNQYYGIQEYYNSNLGLVYQIQGENKQEFLWQPKAYYELNGNNLTVYLTPPNGEWLISITGNNYYNETFGDHSPISFILPYGEYNINATLFAGSQGIEILHSSFNVSGGTVYVSSPVNFYVDGFSHLSGNYEFTTPVNLTFPNLYYQRNNSRMVFKYLIVNNKIVNSNTIVLYTNANVTAVYQQQYFVSFPFELKGYVNNIYQTLNNNWYNEGDQIIIPSQIIYNGSYTRYVIYKQQTYIINSSLNIIPPYYTQYYVKVNQTIPAEINGVNLTLSSNWFNKSSVITIFHIYYFNSTVREIINSNISKIVLEGPISIGIYALYQYLDVIILPNGTISNWFNSNYVITLPSMIYNGSEERYVLNQTQQIVVNKAFNITPSYIKQFYIIIKLPNETESNWFNSNYVITLPSMIYNGSEERYVLNQTQQIVVNKAFNITPSYIKQFYDVIILPNGTISNWFNSNYVITLPSMIYNGSEERYVLNQTQQIVVNKAFNITPSYIKQFYIIIKLPNETESNWFNQGFIITLPSMIYNGSEERYVLNQSNEIIVLQPVEEVPIYTKQFLVTINGVSKWYNKGSTITLSESVPIYETITWVGNYTLPNNSNLTINGPIIENAKISTNDTFVGGVVIGVIIIGAIAIILTRRH